MADFSKLIAEANAAESEAPPEPRVAEVTSIQAHRESEAQERLTPDRETEIEKEREPVEPSSSDVLEILASNEDEPWTNFTTRLRRSTKERFQQFCLERQLSKSKPWGQQDLVEEAIIVLMNRYLRTES